MVFVAGTEPVMHISFSPDDERIGGYTMDGKVVVFTVESNGEKIMVDGFMREWWMG
jgi:hypothetical protein